MWGYIKIVLFGMVAVLAAIAANHASDLTYLVHALVIAAVAAGMFIWSVPPPGRPGRNPR